MVEKNCLFSRQKPPKLGGVGQKKGQRRSRTEKTQVQKTNKQTVTSRIVSKAVVTVAHTDPESQAGVAPPICPPPTDAANESEQSGK